MGTVSGRVLIAISLATLMSISLLKVLRLGIALLIINRNMAIQLLKTVQRMFLKMLLMLRRRDITKGYKNRIAGVIVRLIKRLKLIIGKVRDIRWLTTTVVMIGTGRIEILAHGLPQCRVNRTHGSFHLVIYNPFEG